MLHGAHRRGLLQAGAPSVLVRSHAATVPVGIDGEWVHLDTPVRCTVRAVVLRVRLPRERPGALSGVTAPRPVPRSVAPSGNRALGDGRSGSEAAFDRQRSGRPTEGGGGPWTYR